MLCNHEKNYSLYNVFMITPISKRLMKKDCTTQVLTLTEKDTLEIIVHIKPFDSVLP